MLVDKATSEQLTVGVRFGFILCFCYKFSFFYFVLDIAMYSLSSLPLEYLSLILEVPYKAVEQ